MEKEMDGERDGWRKRQTEKRWMEKEMEERCTEGARIVRKRPPEQQKPGCGVSEYGVSKRHRAGKDAPSFIARLTEAVFSSSSSSESQEQNDEARSTEHTNRPVWTSRAQTQRRVGPTETERRTWARPRSDGATGTVSVVNFRH